MIQICATTHQYSTFTMFILLDDINVGPSSSLDSRSEGVPLEVQRGSKPSSDIGTGCGVGHGVLVEDINHRRNYMCVVLKSV